MEPDSHQSSPANGSVKTTAIVLYGTFAALLLVLPGPVADWCDDHADWAAARALGSVAHAFDAASHKLHVADVYDAARARLSQWIDR
ncbi:MAG: hypothetical protein P4L98_22395 [Ancalomicrobiaceae bacterium]|nr:hypothetical protein [Ancalomicrobiaceae bacterium]